MQNWDEIRTAYLVAHLGTVSAAAEVLGVHHATVIRHVDALERRLGTKLFQRHARGYAPTEAGRDLKIVADSVEGQFTQMVSRIKGLGEVVSGELVVTSIAGMSELITPVLTSFQAAHPDVTIRLLSDSRLFRLEHGEAHVAIRAGSTPKEADYVVQSLAHLPVALYGSTDYIARHGRPKDADDLAGHRFVGVEGPAERAPFYIWLRARVPDSAIVFRVTENAVVEAAVRAGTGLGFLTHNVASRCSDLVEILPPLDEWQTTLWAVTHVDLHRTLKVQTFLTHLKAAAEGWPGTV